MREAWPVGQEPLPPGLTDDCDYMCSGLYSACVNGQGLLGEEVEEEQAVYSQSGLLKRTVSQTQQTSPILRISLHPTQHRDLYGGLACVSITRQKVGLTSPE